ncbi:MAG: SDR family oxidoreductase [Silicimonas sp.]|jgi:NAD(P)-dependent dehydrogenase (short-subunit alcohol dehydrogenase family)|nr:SDR family oxidoreductase [Silicimonas sp.]
MTGRALVTGAGKRIGREIALYLAKRGLDVAIHYHSSADEAAEVARQCRAAGVSAATLAADLTAEDDMQALVPRAAEDLGGPLTVLVNSASIFEHDTIRTATRESWDRHIESNLRAPFVLSQHFAAQVPEPAYDAEWNEPTAQALIVNMIDQRVRKLTPHFASYTIAKMGLWALTQTSAQALAPAVRVNAIGPGPTMQGARQTREHFAAQRRNTILERGADASDVTHAVGYFLDAPSVTGQMICVDGGQHLGWKTPDIQGVE